MKKRRKTRCKLMTATEAMALRQQKEYATNLQIATTFAHEVDIITLSRAMAKQLWVRKCNGLIMRIPTDFGIIEVRFV